MQAMVLGGRGFPGWARDVFLFGPIASRSSSEMGYWVCDGVKVGVVERGARLSRWDCPLLLKPSNGL